MQIPTIAVKKRQEVGKGTVNRLRKKGFIPGVLYGSNIKNLTVSISEKELRKINLDSTHIIKAVVDGESEHTVLIREYQRHPINQKVIHLDLYEVSLTEKLRTVIPLVITGKPKGVTQGGVLQFGIREVEIECLPTDIPEDIDVDVSDLEIGDMKKVGDLVAPSGVTILTDPEQVIVTVVAPVLETESEEEKTEEAAAPTPKSEEA